MGNKAILQLPTECKRGWGLPCFDRNFTIFLACDFLRY